MALGSILNKTIALSQAGKTNKHSKKATNYAKQAMTCFKQAKSLNGDKKIDKMLDGLNYLSYSVLEVSDSVSPISNMNAANTLLANNVQKMINQSQQNIIDTIKNKKR
tara:strand:+ start:893 stop:1216 length:324 start_codon:yes stop_codon:yes gene_type:complete